MEDDEKSGSHINFIPCVTWVRRGVAKPVPERVKLTTEELAAVINQTKNDLAELENDSDTEDAKDTVSDKKTSEKKDKTEEDIIDEYGLADYDDEQETPEGGSKLLGLGDLTAFADPREDPYLSQLDKDVGAEDEEDIEE